MTYIDWILVAIVVLSAAWGAYRGFVREILSLIVWAIAFYVAAYFSTQITGLHSVIASPFVATTVTFFIIFAIVVIVGLLIVALINKMISKTPLSPINRVLGCVFGILRGLILCAVLVWVVEATPYAHSFAWLHSALAPYFLTFVVSVQNGLGPYVDQYINGAKAALGQPIPNT